MHIFLVGWCSLYRKISHAGGTNAVGSKQVRYCFPGYYILWFQPSILKTEDLSFAVVIVRFVPTLTLNVCYVRNLLVKRIGTSLLGRKRKVPSSSTSTSSVPSDSIEPPASVEPDEIAPLSKRKKNQAPPWSQTASARNKSKNQPV